MRFVRIPASPEVTPLSHLPRVLLLVVLALLLTSCTSPGAKDRITEYDTSAVVHADGTVDVTETITYDFGRDPSPGLLREIPLSQRVGLMRHRVWEISDVEVTSPSGAPADIEKQDEWRRLLILEIGDSDAPVTGAQTYEISYTVRGALTEEAFLTEFERAGFYGVSVLKKTFWREVEGCRFLLCDRPRIQVREEGRLPLRGAIRRVSRPDEGDRRRGGAPVSARRARGSVHRYGGEAVGSALHRVVRYCRWAIGAHVDQR